MRIKTSLIIAAGALLAASPALAQNEAGNEAAVAAENVAVPDANVVDVNMAPIDENAALPADTAVIPEDTAAPEPVSEERGFPWGVLGLLGLLGLIPRLRGRS